MKFCKKCGEELENTVKFCSKCGTQQTKDTKKKIPVAVDDTISTKTPAPQKAKNQLAFENFNTKKQEVYKQLKEASPNDGSCDDKDCGHNNCLALAMKIAAGHDCLDSCPYTSKINDGHAQLSIKFNIFDD
jgi:ArsR family metal-binding transcriptional regulator